MIPCNEPVFERTDERAETGRKHETLPFCATDSLAGFIRVLAARRRLETAVVMENVDETASVEPDDVRMRMPERRQDRESRETWRMKPAMRRMLGMNPGAWKNMVQFRRDMRMNSSCGCRFVVMPGEWSG